MRWVTLFLLALAAMVVLPAAADTSGATRNPDSHFFQAGFGNLKEDLATARQEGKLGILLMFEMEECPFCQRMKATVLNRVEVQDYFRQHFLVYPIDVRGDIGLVDFDGNDMAEKTFALRERVRATPVFIFYGLDGKPITRYSGMTRTAEEFLLLGRYVVEGAHRQMPFADYKRQAAARK
jgi:thioredoxin-related protein